MDKARISVDFNEMVDHNIVMLSQTDTRTDSHGSIVALYEGMPISIYEEDIYENGEIDYLIAEGIVIKHDLDDKPKNFRGIINTKEKKGVKAAEKLPIEFRV